MSLTKEDLKAISDLMDVKLEEQQRNINKRFDEIYYGIGRNGKEVATETEKRLYSEIQEIKGVTVQNCFDIACLKQMIK